MDIPDPGFTGKRTKLEIWDLQTEAADIRKEVAKLRKEFNRKLMISTALAFLTVLTIKLFKK